MSAKQETAKQRSERVLHLAQALVDQGVTWVTANNALFGPEGIANILFPTRKERERLVSSAAYKKITGLLESLSDETEASGKFLVRTPKSLHSALQAEAATEGVSLNQLVVTKLAISLSSVAH